LSKTLWHLKKATWVNHPPHKQKPDFLHNDVGIKRVVSPAKMPRLYSELSIFHFQVFFVHHLCSRIKFHINNVIYFCIFRFPYFSFFRLFRCKSRSRHSISHMDCVALFVWEKNWRLKRVICGIRAAHQRHACQTM
jgi:hypothetical protein